jgi:hypothetical protein
MIRKITRPSTARCTLPMYISFLLGEPNCGSCCRLADVMNISHDSANRFLQRERYEGKDLYTESAPHLNLKGGTLSVDDCVLDKPYSQYLAFIGYFWSGKHHRSVKGINLITLYYTDTDGQHLPVNFRVYDKSEGKTKNDYFRDMLEDVMIWGLEPAFVTGDSWYSGVDNLKHVRKHALGWLFAIESNRIVSMDKGNWVQVQKLDIPDDGLRVWLKDFGHVKLFRTWLKDQPRHYAVFLPDDDELTAVGRKTFTDQHDRHWHIEQYHRTIKQVCNIENFQVRSKTAIRNHLFAALCGYIQLQKLSAMALIGNCYGIQRNLFNGVIAGFIGTLMPTMVHLNSEFQAAVNA